MPRIPTPFIGGSDSPRREQGKEVLAPPFHPEAEEAEVTSPAAEPEAVVEEAAESEEAVQIEAAEAEPESGDEAIMAVGGEEPEPLTNDLEEIAAEEFAVGIEEVEEEEETVTAKAGDAFFPDFFDGSDGIGSAEEATDKEAPPSSRERLAQMAEELRAGEFANLIRTLIDELGPYAAEIAIARAFAAGYLAAKDREE